MLRKIRYPIARHRLAPFLLLLLLALVPSQGAFALSFSQVPTLEEILDRASLVVRAEVLDVYSQPMFSADPGELIYSTATLLVHQGFRGADPGSVIEVRYVGGELSSGEAMGIGGLPRWRTGQHVFVAANDTIHPFFGTLYADLGLKIMVEEGTETYVSSAHHSPMLTDPLEAPRDVQCVPNQRFPDTCDRWVDSDGNSLEGPGEGLLKVEDFDTWVFDKLGTASTGPAQTLADDASFRAALAGWWERINTPVSR